MSNDFTKTMANQTDKELVRIVQEAENYHPDAVEAAKAELALRQVPDDLVEKLQQDVAKDREPLVSVKLDFGPPDAPTIAGEANILDVPKTTEKTNGAIGNFITAIGGLFLLYAVAYGYNYIAVIGEYLQQNGELFGSFQSTYFVVITGAQVNLAVASGILFIQKKKLGWYLANILIVLEFAPFAFFAFTSDSFMGFIAQSLTNIYFVLHFAVCMLLLAFLWTPLCRNFFNVTEVVPNINIDRFLPKFEKREE